MTQPTTIPPVVFENPYRICTKITEEEENAIRQIVGKLILYSNGTSQPTPLEHVRIIPTDNPLKPYELSEPITFKSGNDSITLINLGKYHPGEVYPRGLQLKKNYPSYIVKNMMVDYIITIVNDKSWEIACTAENHGKVFTSPSPSACWSQLVDEINVRTDIHLSSGSGISKLGLRHATLIMVLDELQRLEFGASYFDIHLALDQIAKTAPPKRPAETTSTQPSKKSKDLKLQNLKNQKPSPPRPQQTPQISPAWKSIAQTKKCPCGEQFDHVWSLVSHIRLLSDKDSQHSILLASVPRVYLNDNFITKQEAERGRKRTREDVMRTVQGIEIATKLLTSARSQSCPPIIQNSNTRQDHVALIAAAQASAVQSLGKVVTPMVAAAIATSSQHVLASTSNPIRIPLNFKTMASLTNDQDKSIAKRKGKMSSMRASKDQGLDEEDEFSDFDEEDEFPGELLILGHYGPSPSESSYYENAHLSKKDRLQLHEKQLCWQPRDPFQKVDAAWSQYLKIGHVQGLGNQSKGWSRTIYSVTVPHKENMTTAGGYKSYVSTLQHGNPPLMARYTEYLEKAETVETLQSHLTTHHTKDEFAQDLMARLRKDARNSVKHYIDLVKGNKQGDKVDKVLSVLSTVVGILDEFDEKSYDWK